MALVNVTVNVSNKCCKPCQDQDQEQIFKSYMKDISIDNIKITGKIMALSMTDTQQASGTLEFVDKHGHKTDVPDGNVSVSSSDTGVATADYDDPSNTITVKAVGPGVAALSIKATNAKGEDLPFEDVAIEIKSGDAVSGTVNFGEPTEQPETPPTT